MTAAKKKPGETTVSQALLLRLRALRQERDLTQAQLAEMTGVSQQRIANLENLRSKPRLQTLVKLAKALGYELDIQFRRRE